MKRHHEEFAAAPSLVQALTSLIPISVALWLRLKGRRKRQATAAERPEPARGDQ